MIHDYLSSKVEKDLLPDEIPLGLKRIRSLRYGENPHQSAGLYVSNKKENSLANAEIHQGKELSYTISLM